MTDSVTSPTEATAAARSAFAAELQYLTSDDVRLLLDKATPTRYAAGDVIVEEESRRQTLFFVRSGTVRVERAHLANNVAFARMGPGSMFGEMSFLENAGASASVVAETPAEVVAVEGSYVQSLIGSAPGFGTRFYQSLAVVLSGRLREATSLLPPLLVEEVPQVQRFHAARASTGAADALPPRLIESVETFKTAMVVADRGVLSGDLDDEDAHGTVADACTMLSDTLREHVERESHLEADIGAFVFRETFPFFMQSPFLDRSFSKPRGYAGDFETIDIIYLNEAVGSGRLAPLVDRWGLDLKAAQAVRNRRGMMLETIREVAGGLDGEQLRVTSLASGPARELFDLYEDGGGEAPDLRAICIDIDPVALEYASARAERLGVSDRFVFARENVLRMMRGRGNTEVEPQHLIYSLGLVDYFDDRLLVPLIDWVWEHLAPGGLAVIGNFDVVNPDKAFMDHIVEWRLVHRSPDHLKELFEQSKFGARSVEVKSEAAGVQLFAFARR